MAQIISANDYEGAGGRLADDYLSAVTPLTVRDFMEHARFPMHASPVRKVCLADTATSEEPQSQVDQLISDLMDIIVRASGVPVENSVSEKSRDAVAEEVALSMMQALLDKQVCSSF